MKRFLPFLLVVILVGVVANHLMAQSDLFSKASGDNSHTESDHNDHPKEAIETGIISSLGSITVPGSGTHLLIKSDRSTILLTGLGVNLDDYLQQQVEVEGRLSESESGKSIIQVLRATVIVPEASTETTLDPKEAMKWETFQDETLGVSFQRRLGWKLESAKDLLTFTTPSTITIQRLANPSGASLASFTGDQKAATRNLIGPRKLSGYKRYESDTGIITFAVAREQHVFVMKFTPQDPKMANASSNDFFRLISSFDFIPVVK